MQELPFLRSARRLMLIDICMKFREDSFRGFQVTERTQFVTDRRTDRRPGKNNMSPNPSGGDIISMTSNKCMEPKKKFWPIRMKLSKPFCRQLTHYAEKFLHELLSNISLIKCPTPIGSSKIRPLTSCVISLDQYIISKGCIFHGFYGFSA